MTASTPPKIATTRFEPLTWTWKGHQIQYTVQGSGHPLVLIHGFGASIGHWRQNISVLAEGGYRVFALDLLGFGASAKPILDYSLELWEELLTDFWAENIKQPAIFIGNSIGALLSLIMVAQHPEISSGAVLLNCAGGLNHRPEELNFPLRAIMGLFTKFVSSPIIGSFMFNQIRQKHRIRNTLRQVYGNQEAITDELVDLLYTPSNDIGAQQVFASILTAPPGPHPSELLPHIQKPLLIIWGETDPWTPITGAKIYQDLADLSESVEFISIPNTGHCPHDERPEQVNPIILNWLNQHSF
ncbi:Hydrolase, alpha/beta fold family domain protein [Planktothrix serta PCC 8927]|uniref:Hydrolase, alpha/beta fold family domain protein n=1 Tax=Planktothrix serta PCC 8927 TaxID=671068 RepID=A0A7Z9BU97_9CYAN|nr:alpha/beta fold hydrolase [Planktothrix serta]VXD18375.1 Hydrolase, alpha/beta fold family domain protein [Planktothrix serta PCC 8927]